jgi:hypothetical protein
MNNKQKGITSIATIGLVILVLLAVAGTTYFLLNNKPQIACTMETKICPDGSSVGRTGPNCEFAACPVDETAGWKDQTNTQYGFGFKYPSDFFNSNQEPKILVGDCNYSVFPDKCPDIKDIVTKDLASLSGDINIIKDNLSSANYWKNPNGEKSTVNNTTYCLYQTQDAATGHIYNSYYYATVTDNKCLVVNLNTSTTNCDFYLPIEEGNTEQQQNYDNCLTTNQNQPIVLKKIISTFKFTN